jgi:NAD(P)-dependent dehydrogenase (short-subunit alcohol dehydrogenase family)
MLILNAGTFPKSKKISELDDDTFAKTLQLNLNANLTFLREAFPLLACAPKAGG